MVHQCHSGRPRVCDGGQVIDHEGPTPLYVQVADAVQARIETGELAPNRAIPSENQLVHEYGVARGTARKSIQLLRERGLVVTVVGRGTFVAERPQPPSR